jgi:hypothetical protein
VPGVTNFIDCKLIVRREVKLDSGKQSLYLAASNPSLRPKPEKQISLQRRLNGYRELMAEIKLSEGCPVGPALPGYVMALEYMRLAPFESGNEMVAIHRLESEWCAPFPHLRELAATYPQLSFDMTYFGADEGLCGSVIAREGEIAGRFECDITPMEEKTPLLTVEEQSEMPSYLVDWQWFTLIQAYRAAGLREGEVVRIPPLEDPYENAPGLIGKAKWESEAEEAEFLAFVGQFSEG